MSRNADSAMPLYFILGMAATMMVGRTIYEKRREKQVLAERRKAAEAEAKAREKDELMEKIRRTNGLGRWTK